MQCTTQSRVNTLPICVSIVLCYKHPRCVKPTEEYITTYLDSRAVSCSCQCTSAGQRSSHLHHVHNVKCASFQASPRPRLCHAVRGGTSSITFFQWGARQMERPEQPSRVHRSRQPWVAVVSIACRRQAPPPKQGALCSMSVCFSALAATPAFL